MQVRGKVVRWNEDRGFGFIRGNASAAEVFFHVRDFRGESGRPAEGLDVVFEEIHVGGKGPRAVAVRPALQLEPMRRPQHQSQSPRTSVSAPHRSGARRTPHQASAQRETSSGAAILLPLILVYAAALGWGVWTKRLPGWAPLTLLAINVATFMAYWQDKYAASKRLWRTPENALHVWSALGGWPAAWAAQQVLRHKSRKAEFLSVYRSTLLLNLGITGAWLWRADIFRSLIPALNGFMVRML